MFQLKLGADWADDILMRRAAKFAPKKFITVYNFFRAPTRRVFCCKPLMLLMKVVGAPGLEPGTR